MHEIKSLGVHALTVIKSMRIKKPQAVKNLLGLYRYKGSIERDTRKGNVMEIKFKFVAEFEHTAPIISARTYNSFADCLKGAKTVFTDKTVAKKVWVYQFNVYSIIQEFNAANQTLVFENGKFIL